MENKDVIISNALKSIEEKKRGFENFKPEENYRYKTNCRFGEKGNEKNIKTLSISDLLNCYVEAKLFADTLQNINDTFSYIPLVYKDSVKVRLYGFLPEEWMSDIEQEIKKLCYKDAVANLENSAYQLEQFYSKDKQDEIAINSILSNLGL